MIRTPDTLDDVPNAPKNKHRMVRFTNDDWAELGDKAQQMGTTRSEVLRQLAQWWMRHRDAKLPPRPDPSRPDR